MKRGGSNSDKEIAQRVDGKSSVEEREPDGYWAKTWTLSWGVATLPTAIQSCSMPTSSSSQSSSSSSTSPTTNNYQDLHDNCHWKWLNAQQESDEKMTTRFSSKINYKLTASEYHDWPSKEYRTWSPCLTFLSSSHFDAASEQRELLFRPDDWKGIIAKGNVFT